MVPGHEIIGVVTEVGKNVKSFKLGDRAGVGCFVDSCRECQQCHGHEEQFCENGMVCNGPDLCRHSSGCLVCGLCDSVS